MWFTGRAETHPGAPGEPRCGRAADRGVAPLGRFRRAAARAARCKRGAYSVEFAVVASSLLVLVLGAAEMAWHGLTSVAVENALLHATRASSLGCKQADGSRAGQAGPNEIKKAARIGGGANAAGVGGLVGGNSLSLTPIAFNNLSGANAPAGTGGTRAGGTNGTGNSGQIVEYRLAYDPPLLFIGKLINRSSYSHGGTITIKNEPFSNGGAGATACS